MSPLSLPLLSSPCASALKRKSLNAVLSKNDLAYKIAEVCTAAKDVVVTTKIFDAVGLVIRAVDGQWSKNW